jgi:hypothetical protein
VTTVARENLRLEVGNTPEQFHFQIPVRCCWRGGVKVGAAPGPYLCVLAIQLAWDGNPVSTSEMVD